MDNNEKYSALVGKTLDNRYKVLQVVSPGGMSVVLKAQDTVMNRVVAIKVLNDECSADEAAVRRFINESKAVAMLSHPNIVNIFDVAFGGELKYIVMEYIDGITLNDYMQRKGKLPWRDAVHFADQILLALEHAHEKGIVHRDIKPQNIMLLRNGAVKVADFGIATLPNIDSRTQGKAIGTVYYMSPEQACGRPTDFSTDIYSLGVMMYEMITGQLPFDGDTPSDIASKQVNELPREPRSLEITIPRGLEQIILKAMEKRPEDRYPNARTMHRALQILKNNPSIVFAEKSAGNGAQGAQSQGSGNGQPRPTRQFDPVKDNGKIPVRNTPVNANEKPKPEKPKAPADGAPKRTRRPKSTMFPIILGVALAFLTVAIVGGIVLAASIFENSNGVGTVYVIPDYTGSEYGELLREQIISDGLRLIDVKYQYDRDSTKDYVVAQEPAPNSKRKSRDLVLTVSLGSQTVIMSDLVMCHYTKAEVYLGNVGLKPVIQRVDDPAVMSNYIIRTEPAQGQPVKIGDTVTLYVSNGYTPQFVPMPDVVGLDIEEAKRLLTENGITMVKEIKVPSGKPDGQVLDQDPLPDAQITKGSGEAILGISEYDSALDIPQPPEDLPVSSPAEDNPDDQPDTTPTQDNPDQTGDAPTEDNPTQDNPEQQPGETPEQPGEPTEQPGEQTEQPVEQPGETPEPAPEQPNDTAAQV